VILGVECGHNESAGRQIVDERQAGRPSGAPPEQI
jgi:hypothetical protein